LASRHALVRRIERLAGSAAPRVRLNYYAIGGTVMMFAVLTLALQAFSPALALSSPHAGSAQTSGNGLLAAACARPDAEAHYLDGPAPLTPHGLNFKGGATIVVTVAPTGKVVHASTLKSSGNAQIDQAVLEAAQRGKYAPKLVNCKPVESNYLFHATFDPNAH
jgi:TonB family protein